MLCARCLHVYSRLLYKFTRVLFNSYESMERKKEDETCQLVYFGVFLIHCMTSIIIVLLDCADGGYIFVENVILYNLY